MTNEIKRIVLEALEKGFSGCMSLHNIETWNSGYIDESSCKLTAAYGDNDEGNQL